MFQPDGELATAVFLSFNLEKLLRTTVHFVHLGLLDFSTNAVSKLMIKQRKGESQFVCKLKASLEKKKLLSEQV